MARNRSFSVYLLKTGYDLSNALKEDSSLVPVEAIDLPVGAHLYLLDGTPRPPWWKTYFGVTQQLLQVSKGALVFVSAGDRMFALAFGNVARNLEEECYEHDFGLRVTLNCVDPHRLKNTDTLEPGASRRRRTQLATETELTYFDFDYDSSVLKSITGKVREEYKDLITQATGSSNLRINTSVRSKELVGLCDKLLELYAKEDYLTSFPNIQKIEPVREPSQITALNMLLCDAVRSRNDSLALSVPDLIDYNYEGPLYVSFSGAGSSDLYPDVEIDHYFSYLDAKGFELEKLTIDQLKSHRMRLVDEEDAPHNTYQIYRSLIFDTEIPGDSAAYYLNEGNWFRVDTEFVSSLQSKLDGYFSTLDLPDYTKGSEGDYNTAVGDKPGFVCLDTKDISPKKQTAIEPCDIYRVEENRAVLIHVKISTSARELSHLFNQGANSMELLKGEQEAVDNLMDRIKEKSSQGTNISVLTKPLQDGNYKLVYAIITRKTPEGKSLNLPLFSRISLARSVKNVHKIMGIPVEIGYVKDARPPKPSKPKKSKAGTRKATTT